jgi:hypothetical protein
VAILRTGEHAIFGAAENAVAVAGDEAIPSVAQRSGQESEDDTEDLPESAKALENEDNDVRAREETFVRKFVIEDDVDGVKVLRIGIVTGQDTRGERTLQRGKAKDGVGIAAEDELIQAVAESACAVVKNDRVSHGFGSHG